MNKFGQSLLLAASISAALLLASTISRAEAIFPFIATDYDNLCKGNLACAKEQYAALKWVHNWRLGDKSQDRYQTAIGCLLLNSKILTKTEANRAGYKGNGGMMDIDIPRDITKQKECILQTPDAGIKAYVNWKQTYHFGD